GVVILDLADPANPRLLGRTTFEPNEQGNAHSVDLLRGGAVLVEADEVLDTKEGALRVDGPPELAGLLAAGGSLPAPPWPVTRTEDLRGHHDFGGLHFWDVADPARPRALSSFRTPRSQVDRAAGPAEPGVFSAHNPVVQGDLLFVSWFSDGVRVVDVRDPAH